MKKYLLGSLSILILCLLVACCTANRESGYNGRDLGDYDLVYTETISPNEEYVEREEDVVYYTVNVYQNSDNNCVVTATPNSHFFDGLEYEYQCNAKLSKSDISIKWLTIMGTEEASKENQYIIADVILSADDKVVSERKINFAKKVIENIGDVLNSKENTK